LLILTSWLILSINHQLISEIGDFMGKKIIFDFCLLSASEPVSN
jgi:hypothetical protein